MRRTRNFECSADCGAMIVGVQVKQPRRLGWIEVRDKDGNHAFHHADCVLKWYARHPAEPDEVEETAPAEEGDEPDADV